MDWSNERYVRLYTRDTKTWKLIGWEGQMVWCLTLRKLDRAGVLDDVHDAEDLTVMIGAPLEVVEIGLARLLKYEVLIDSAKGLVSPNFIDAQEAAQSDKQRSKEARARKRDRALAPRPINADTNRDVMSDTIRDENVTGGHSASRGVTARHSVPNRARLTTAVGRDGGGCSAEVPCPDPKSLLTDEQRMTLETSMIPGWAVDAILVRFAAKYQGDPNDKRTMAAWRKCASMAVSGDWHDPNKRPARPRDDQGNEDAQVAARFIG